MEWLLPTPSACYVYMSGVQELAMKLRAEGKEYKHHHKLQQPEKRKADDSSHGDKKDKRAKHEAKAYLGDKQPTWRPFNDIDVSCDCVRGLRTWQSSNLMRKCAGFVTSF